jgi:putative DNA primase/helicase
LYHKCANVFPDLQPDAIDKTGMFKALTGEDYIYAELKMVQKRVMFCNYAKHFFSANRLPEVTDDTDAFFRRWLILSFEKTFIGAQCDPFKLQKITTPTEFSGLFNLVMPTLKPLLERGTFSGSKSISELEDEWKRQSDPIWAFVLDMILKDPEGEIEKDELYTVYHNYCEEHDYPIDDKAVLSKKLIQKTGVKSVYHQKPIKKHVWRGLKLKFAQGTEDGQTQL